MATAYGAWTGPGGNAYRSVLDYSVVDGGTTVTISTTLKIQISSSYGGIYGSDVHGTITIGTGNGNTTTKRVSANYDRGNTYTIVTKARTYSKTGSAQSIALGGTVTVNSASTASATVTIPKLTYSITYNANGGDANTLPASQTKTHGVAITLSNRAPTRLGFTFLGWNTKANGSGTHYAAGASYSGNANLKLYAMWLGVSAPTLSAKRTDSDGEEDDDGTWGVINGSWQASGTVAATISVTALNVTKSSSIALSGNTSSSFVAGGSASGNVTSKFGADSPSADALDTDTRYQIRMTVTVTTTYGGGKTITKTATAYVSYAYTAFEAKAGGHGVSIGAPAVQDGFNVYMPATFYDDVTAPNIGSIVSANASTNVASEVGVAITSLTLDPGTYIIEGNVSFAANAAGNRTIDLSTISGSVTSSVVAQTGMQVPASDGLTALHVTWATRRTAQTTVYLNAYQSSGSTLSVTGYIRAIRIA